MAQTFSASQTCLAFIGVRREGFDLPNLHPSIGILLTLQYRMFPSLGHPKVVYRAFERTDSCRKLSTLGNWIAWEHGNFKHACKHPPYRGKPLEALLTNHPARLTTSLPLKLQSVVCPFIPSSLHPLVPLSFSLPSKSTSDPALTSLFLFGLHPEPFLFLTHSISGSCQRLIC